MPPTDSLPYRADIQGLRAIAIILVVLAHAGISGFSGGFVGVDVFFVLSGYLITGLLIHEYATTNKIQLLSFFSRRLKRLLPSLLVMASLVVLAATLLLSKYEVRELGTSIAYAATWTSNLFFAFSTVDYFAELRNQDLFLHTWSLGVEEQYYLVWPLLLLLMLTLLKRQPVRGDRRTQLLIILGLLFAGSLGLSLYWTEKNPLWSFYLMPSRIWQFALGAGVFVWLNAHCPDGRVQKPFRARDTGIGITGMLLIIGSGMLLHPELAYPGFWALLPSVGAAMVIMAGGGGSFRVLASPLLVWIGNRSYSWYLWHWPVLMLGSAVGVKHRLIETVILMVLSLLLATLSYRWVEQPIWKGRLSHATPKLTILVSILAMLMVILVTTHNFKLSPQEEERQSKAISTINAARADLPMIYALGCDDWYTNADVRPCMIGKSNAPKTVVLLGDSIGAQWFSLLPEIFRAPEWRTMVLTKSACAMVDEEFFYSRIGKIYDVCTKWRNATLEFLHSLHPDVVFVGSAATYNFTESQWVEGSTRVLDKLAAASGHVIVVPGTPKLSFDGPGCIERQVLTADRVVPYGAPICNETTFSNQAANVASYLELAASRFPNVSLLDLNDLVCPGAQCAAKDPSGFVVFRDSQHLTNSFVRKQVPNVVERLKKKGMEPAYAK